MTAKQKQQIRQGRLYGPSRTSAQAYAVLESLKKTGTTKCWEDNSSKVSAETRN